ncbi:MAG: hypothetical protein WD939_10865 [Dehalococcoidia bacterium]
MEVRDVLRPGTLVLALALTTLAACSGGGPEQSNGADIETAARDYFRAAGEGDASAFCARIEPSLGLFVSEENCLDVQRHFKEASWDWFGPHFETDVGYEPIVPEVLGVTNTEVRGDRASTVASVVWTGEKDGVSQPFGRVELEINFVREKSVWRIASFGNDATPPSGEPDVVAVAQGVNDYYDGLRADLQKPFWTERPTDLGEHRERNVLSKIAGVQFKDEYAAATIDAHIVDNGAIGHPNRYFIVLRHGGGSWAVVAPSDPAYGLFADSE